MSTAEIASGIQRDWKKPYFGAVPYLEAMALDILPRLLEVGCKIAKQDGQWWIFEHDGEGVVGGNTFREMCEKLVEVDIDAHERRYLER